MKYSNIIYVVLFLLTGFGSQAQDIHFSQFYNMPLQLNPALTGHIEGNYRVKLLYRNQWNSITGGGVYSTPGLSFDMNFKFKEEDENSLGGGIAVINDQTGAGDFNNTYVLGSVAYHISLVKNQKAYLSLGLQGGYSNKRLDEANLVFTDQLDANGNPTNGTMENFSNSNASGGDLRVGAVLSGYPSAKMDYKFGLAFHHIIRAKEEFLAGTTTTNKVPGLLSVFGEMDLMTKNPKFRLMPRIILMTQSKITELNLTSNMGYKVTPDIELVFGAAYRLSDAAIANLGMNYKGVEFLASYDINVSKLTPASRANGGFEISLGYVGRFNKPVKPELPCVRFL